MCLCVGVYVSSCVGVVRQCVKGEHTRVILEFWWKKRSYKSDSPYKAVENDS